MDKLATAEKLEKAAVNLTTKGWCTGSLFMNNAGAKKACAVGHMLRSELGWESMDDIYASTVEDVYQHPAITDMMEALAPDLRDEILAYYQDAFADGPHRFPDEITPEDMVEQTYDADSSGPVVMFNDHIAKNADEVAAKMMETAARLRREAKEEEETDEDGGA